MSEHEAERRADVGASAAREGDDAWGEDATVVRHEEELEVGTQTVEYGAVRARKHVEETHVGEDVDRQIEYVDDVEHVSAADGDSGEVETLPDGSVSVPVFEERLVIQKQLVVRERVIIRKRTVTEQERVEADLRREHVEVDTSQVDEPGAAGT